MEFRSPENSRRAGVPFGRAGAPGGGAPGIATRPADPVRPAASPTLSPADIGRAERDLGLTLHRLRLEHGLSLRALAQRLGYSAHSVFSAIEKGRRIPSESLIRSYEQCFGLPAGALRALRRKAMAERAERMTALLAAHVHADAGGPGGGAGPGPAGGARGAAGYGHGHGPAVVHRPGPRPSTAFGGGDEESVTAALSRLAAAVRDSTRRVFDRWSPWSPRW